MRPMRPNPAPPRPRWRASLWAAIGLAGVILAHGGGALRADGEPAGAFDYYILSLSWSPSWCTLEGKGRGSPQCRPGRGFGWVLHGLWPQYERGWPSYCRSARRNPSRAETAAMADIMGSPGAAWYQWKKHGRCSGLAPEAYFSAARKAFRAIRLPRRFAPERAGGKIDARALEAAFLAANPGLAADEITITCKRGLVQEVRICLDRALRPRACAADAARDCTLPDALFPAPE